MLPAHRAALRALALGAELDEDASGKPAFSQGGPDSAPVQSQSSSRPSKLGDAAGDTTDAALSKAVGTYRTSMRALAGVLDVAINAFKAAQPDSQSQTEIVAALRALKALKTQVGSTKDTVDRALDL